MIAVFTSNWWALVLRGLVALLFGVLTFHWPEVSLTALVFLFGAYAILFGALLMALGLRLRGRRARLVEIRAVA